jgi:hypothetical protein
VTATFLRKSFLAIVVSSCCLVLTATVAAPADGPVDAKAKIKELQKQRSEVAQKARDLLVEQFKGGFLPSGFDNVDTFLLRLIDMHKLVLHARLDLAETKAERIQAIEETIKDVALLVKSLENKRNTGLASVPVNTYLAQAQLLELKIALERAKQENGPR